MVTRQEYTKLSMEAYGNSAPAGWRIIERPDSTLTQSGFYAAAYQNVSTGEIVIAFRGTEFTDTGDLAADSAILFDSEHRQFVDALEFALAVRDRYQGQGYSISVTGHSLGGALAQLTADVFGWGGETFDAPGMEKYRDYTARSGIYLDTFFAEHPELSFGEVKGLHNYTVWGGAISSIPGAHIGTKQEVLTSDSSQGVVGLMVELGIGGDVAGVILAAANAGDQLGSHSMAGIYNHFRNLTQGGRFVSEYIEAVTSRGVMGYSTDGYVGALTDYLDYLFGDEPPLSQEQAEFMLQDLETLKSQPPFSEPGNSALLDDLIKAQDTLRIATQDIESVTVDNGHWSEQPGDNNELTVRIELQHALDQEVQWVRVDLPNTNPVTGEPMGYVVSSQNVRPVTREIGGVLSYTVIDYYLVRVEPGANYTEFTLRALPDSDQDDNRLELGNLVVSLPGRDTPSHSLLLSIHEEEADANDAQTTHTIVGDLQWKDFDADEPGIQVRYDELGNKIYANPAVQAINQNDELYDSVGNDLITSGGGDDIIHAWRGGDDHIQAGDGQDKVYAGAGDDVIEGGADTDRRVGSDDVWYLHVTLLRVVA